MDKPIVWIIDTSVFLNVLDHPERNQNRAEVRALFQTYVDRGG